MIKGNDYKKSLRETFINTYYSIYPNTCEEIVSIMSSSLNWDCGIYKDS